MTLSVYATIKSLADRFGIELPAALGSTEDTFNQGPLEDRVDFARTVITSAAARLEAMQQPRKSTSRQTPYRPPVRDIPNSPIQSWQLESNEAHLDLFFPYLLQAGGIFIGPATDASLTLLAASASVKALLCDISPWAITKMILIRALIQTSSSPDKFVAAYAKARQDKKIDRELTPSDRSFMAQHDMPFSLLPQPKYYERLAANGHSWLSSPVRYDRLRNLFRYGNIWMTRGSLTDNATWRRIRLVTQRYKIPVDHLYLGNIPLNVFKHPLGLSQSLRKTLAPEATIFRTTVGPIGSSQDPWDYHVVDFRYMSLLLEALTVGDSAFSNYLDFLRKYVPSHITPKLTANTLLRHPKIELINKQAPKVQLDELPEEIQDVTDPFNPLDQISFASALPGMNQLLIKR